MCSEVQQRALGPMPSWWYSPALTHRHAGVPMTETTSPDSLAYSVAGFCKAIGISQRTFWSLQAAANGPPLVRIGRRVLVRKEAAETWLKAREAA